MHMHRLIQLVHDEMHPCTQKSTCWPVILTPQFALSAGGLACLTYHVAVGAASGHGMSTAAQRVPATDVQRVFATWANHKPRLALNAQKGSLYMPL